MANIRIKDLATTATATSSDDYFAIDGTSSNTRKISAYTPVFGGGATVNGLLGLQKDGAYTSTIEGAQTVAATGNSFLFKNSGASTLLTLAYDATATFAGAMKVSGGGNNTIAFEATSTPSLFPRSVQIETNDSGNTFITANSFGSARNAAPALNQDLTIGTNGSSVSNDIIFALGLNGTYTEKLRLATNTATFAGAVVAPSLTAPAATALALAAGSGNQNITLTPSGTGVLAVSGAATISSATAGSASAGAIVATGGISAKNLFVTAAVATYDNTNPSIAFTSGGGALGFYSQGNTVYFASTAQRIMGFTNTGLSLSINGDATSPNIATDSAGASGFFAPANGGIAYSGGGTERFRIAVSTGLATFAGAVAIGNTVTASVAAPSTHKVSILIGGVQYYLLASNV